MARQRIAELTLKLEQVEGQAQQLAVALSQEKAAREQSARLEQVVEALRHTEERYRLLAQSTNDAIWDYDYATDHIEYNARFVEMYGHVAATGSEAFRQWQMHIHPEDRPRVEATHEAFLKSGHDVLDLAYRVRLANRSYAHVRDRTILQRDEHGQPRRLVGSSTDISGEARAREALEAEALVRRHAEQLVRAHAALTLDTLRSITREPTLEAVIGQVLKAIVDELRGIGGTLSLPGPVPGTVVAYLVYADGKLVRGEASDHPAREPQKPPHLTAWTADSAEPEILDEQYLSTSSGFAPFREWARRHGIKTVLQVPLLFGGEAFGVLAVRFAVKRQFAAEELELVKALALQGTLAVRLTQLSEEAQRLAAFREREQAAQRRVAELERGVAALQQLWKLGSVQDLKPLMEPLLREAEDVAQAIMATIFVYQEGADTLSVPWCVRCGEPIDVGTEPGFEIWRSPMPASLITAWDQVNEAKGHAWFSFEDPTSHTSRYSRQWHLSMGHRSMLAVPLVLGEQRLGYLALFFGQASPPPEYSEIARVFAFRATSAIHMARLGEQAQSATIMREREQAAQDKAVALETVNRLLRSEVTERQRAEQLLRTHAAVISAGLRSLTLQPSLEGFTRQCLKTIVEQLGGMGGALWIPVDGSQQIRMFLNYQAGSFERGEESSHPYRDSARSPLRMSDLPGRTTLEPLVLTREDIDRDSDSTEIEWWERLAIRTALIVPLVFGDESLGALTVRFSEEHRFSSEELDLAKVVALQATLSAQLSRLGEQGRKSAVLEERARMARDIHDTLAQGFTGVIVQLEAAADALTRTLTSNALRHIDRAGELARQSLAEARRSVHALKALALEQAELSGAFKELLERMTSETGIHAEFRLHGLPRPLPPEWEQELFHIGQEALTNAMRHAQASRFIAVLAYESASVVLTLRDDGIGFDSSHAVREGIGLIGMHERASAIGADLKVISAPGKGTEIVVLLSD